MTLSKKEILREIEANYEKFKELPEGMRNRKFGKTALMRSGEVVEWFDSCADAERAGRIAYEDGIFSIQTVRHPVDLGIRSAALNLR